MHYYYEGKFPISNCIIFLDPYKNSDIIAVFPSYLAFSYSYLATLNININNIYLNQHNIIDYYYYNKIPIFSFTVPINTLPFISAFKDIKAA